jgi:hypothetical protein
MKVPVAVIIFRRNQRGWDGRGHVTWMSNTKNAYKISVWKPEGRVPFGKPKCTRVYPKVSELATWSEKCKWYSSLPLGAVISLFCESV